MAALPNPTPVRRLCELLNEQQEPFQLDVYLLENGYSKKQLNFKSSNKCWLGDPCNNLQKFTRNSLKNKKNCDQILKCSKLLKSVFVKLVSVKNRDNSNYDNKVSDNRKSGASGVSGSVMEIDRTTPIAEPDRFSSASSSTVFESCSDSETEGSLSTNKNSVSHSATEDFRALKLTNLKEPEAVTDNKLQCLFPEDCKQFSPVSVLELPSDEGSPVHNHRKFCNRTGTEENPTTSNSNLPIKITEESIFSGSLCDFLLQSLPEKHGLRTVELQEIFGSAPSQDIQTKKILQQTRQLLFDCVREVVEIHGSKGKDGYRTGFFQPWLVHEYLCPDQLGQIICQQIYSWCKTPGDISNITQLLEKDFSKPEQQWRHFPPQIKDIGAEIEQAIFADLIDEIILDVIEV